ncbi:hypothetical protein [Streptomyces chartreusis]|uniref:Uncharacterized protein n=1 Tax=Streptomyces chartreusis TaxID=1969 RepID=A0A7H8TIJ4_STRCX|nr:hypothetical protein [Streptomyces chartreusis]QKZ22872.1 hypothetical protein HUT05_39305 [Streptomyces chartreusis]
MDMEQRLGTKLAPESVTTTLIRAGCFLSAYELIKPQVIDRVRDFFLCGIEEGEESYDEVWSEYRQNVVVRNPKNRYLASCDWLVEMKALTAEQVATLGEIQKCRHEVAHELPKLLVDPDFEVRIDLLAAAVEIVRRLGVFWGSITADTDPQFDGQEIEYDDIKSGPYLLMEYLASIAGIGQNG